MTRHTSSHTPHTERTRTHYATARLNPLYFSIVTLAINLLSLALPILAMQVYDRIIAREGVSTLYILSIGTAIAIIAETCLRIGRTYLTASIGATHEYALRRNAIEHTLGTDIRSLQRIGTSRLMQFMDSIAKLREFYSGQAIIAFIDIPFICLFLALIAYLGGAIAIAPAVLVVIFIYRTWRSGRTLMHQIVAHEKIEASRYQSIFEMLNGIHTIKAYAAENTMMRRYEDIQERSARTSYTITESAGNAYNDGALFSHLMTASVLVAGAYMSLQGHLSMGALVACMLLSGRIMMPLQRVLSLWVQYQDMTLARERMEELFNLPSTAGKALPDVHISNTDLVLNDVSFTHYGYTQPTIRNLSLTLEAGAAIAIHGPSGCGKSSLLKLLAGIYTPDQGHVTIGSTSIHSLTPHERARAIGYLATKGAIFQGSLDNNISGFGSSDAHAITHITQLLGIDDEIARLPAGYETPLENTPADAVPPGLKQRISLARTLAFRPRIILFDNADRALDKEGYNYIFRLLARIKGKATLVLVSEDRNLLHLADRHYLLRDGTLEITFDYGAGGQESTGYQELRL